MNSPFRRNAVPLFISHLRDLCALLLSSHSRVSACIRAFSAPDKSGQIRTKTHPPSADVLTYQPLPSGHFSFVRTLRVLLGPFISLLRALPFNSLAVQKLLEGSPCS